MWSTTRLVDVSVCKKGKITLIEQLDCYNTDYNYFTNHFVEYTPFPTFVVM